MGIHQPGQASSRSILLEEVDWKPFSAFPPLARLASEPMSLLPMSTVVATSRPRGARAGLLLQLNRTRSTWDRRHHVKFEGG